MTTIDGEYFPSPDRKPHPRIKPEASEYAERNRGGMEKWFDHSGNMDYQSPRPAERNISDEARKNAQVNKGSMSEVLGGYADPPMQRNIHPRAVKKEANDIAEANKGDGMRNLMENYGNLGLSDRPVPKVKGVDAEEYAQRNQGTVDHLINNYGVVTPQAPPAPKVKYGAEEVAAKHTGAGMGPLLRMELEKTPREPKFGKLHQESQDVGWDEIPPAIRTRPEAEGIVEKNSADSIGNLMQGKVKPPTQRDPKLLKHMQESETPSPQTSPLRTRPEAMHNYQKNQNQSSEMAAILRGEATVNTPSRRSNKMNKRSEEW
ncbi:hypothetical protein ACJMK2_018919 [Sinanodonta woodiana]|uniref:Uncharacterized protein n=1 Tax=Sinanodonta woodiana TaxID=1069815 RepID=A0ABD3UGH2_SINWO